MINKLQRTGKVPIPEEIEQIPIQISTTSVRTAPIKAQFKTARRKPTDAEKNAEAIANIVLEEAANKPTDKASGLWNRDLPLQNEYPELILMPAAAEIKAARNIGTGLLRTAAGAIIGDEMAHGAANLGQKLDNVLSTRMFTPTFGFLGGLGGYTLGSNMMGGIASSLRLPRKTTVNQANYQGYMTDNQMPIQKQNLIQQADSPKLLTQGQSYPLVLKQTPKFYEYANPRELQTTSEWFNEVVPRLNSLSIKTARERILDMIASRKQRGLPAMSMKVKDMFGREVELPEEWVAAMQTPEFEAAYPNGVDYYWRGTDQPVTNTNIKTQYPALFGGDHEMALGYNSGGFFGGAKPVYSMENVGKPNMLLLAVPKGTVTDYGDFGGAHWTSLHDQSTEAITNAKKLKELNKRLSNLSWGDPEYNDVYKQIDELIANQRDNHIFKIDGKALRSTDDVARWLNDNNKAGGALLRNINDGPIANEIIYNHHLIAPKIVTPYSTFEYNLGNESFLKQGGIIKGRDGFLNTWQKAYNSKFGKGLRDFMFGKDRDLSDEKYLEKYGYNKPVGGIGVLGALVAPEWEGLEIPEIAAQHIGNQGKVLRWFESGNSKMLKVPIKETSKKVSNWQKFLKLSQQEQDDFVRRWNGESFQGFATLKGDKQALSKFRSWINSRK